jgi:16S rRNA (uracil1498-N3)-methyltransferase
VTANQFYVPRIAKEAARIVLDGDEHRHLAKAARVRAGDLVRLFDARGGRCRARVETVGEDRTELAVLEVEEPETARTEVVLAQCLIEAKKLETVLEKAAELGCSDFVPVVSARSLKASEERLERKLDRWRRIAREAAKQSKGRTTTAPHPPRTLKDFLRDPPAGLRLFLSERGGRPLREIVTGRGSEGQAPPASAVLLVGPKGGWTEGEEKDIRRAGFEAVTLGRRILRAETAALAAAAMIIHFWNE